MGLETNAEKAVKEPLLEKMSSRLMLLKDRLENIADRSNNLSSRLIGPAPPIEVATAPDVSCSALVGSIEGSLGECEQLAVRIQETISQLEALG